MKPSNKSLFWSREVLRYHAGGLTILIEWFLVFWFLIHSDKFQSHGKVIPGKYGVKRHNMLQQQPFSHPAIFHGKL